MKLRFCKLFFAFRNTDNSAYFIRWSSIISSILAQLTAPIPGESPCGTNINYDAEFDLLKSEVGKPSAIDCDLVEKLSLSILSTKSKDLRVFAFLSYALARKQNFEAYADLFEALLSFCDTQFEVVFPDRERGRIMALKWLIEERYTFALDLQNPAAGDYEHIKRLVDVLEKLKPLLEAKVKGDTVFPGNIYKKATTWEKSLRPQPVAQSTGSPAAAGTPGQSAPGVAGDAGGAAEPMDTPKQAIAVAKKAARVLIEKEPVKPMGYRLMRTLRWDLVEKAPPAENLKTQLAPPDAAARTYFSTLGNQGDPATVFDKSEQAFTGGANHLWIDLQRVSAHLCGVLGSQYAAVREAIVAETGRLIRRVPQITDLQFSDGTPLCDDATKQWIKDDVEKAAGSIGSGATSSTASPQPADGALAHALQEKINPLEAELDAVTKLVAANKIEDALELLQNAIYNSSKEQDNFKRLRTMSSLLLTAKKPDIALSVLDSLDEKIALYHLEKWDPDLAVDTWALLVKAIRLSMPGKPPAITVGLTERQSQVIKKISCIDTRKAFSL